MTDFTTTRQCMARRLTGSTTSTQTECIAEEVPVALAYNGLSHVVMMATPADLDDFALGFSLSEGIIGRAGELQDVECMASSTGITLDLRIPESRFHALKQQRRNLTGRTGCGLCGQESLAAAIRPVVTVHHRLRTHPAAIADALRNLADHQPLNQQTGAVHAAAFARHGALAVREDVGRHNALDKLIGALARADIPAEEGFLLISSRASYEMVHKAAAAGIGLLAAISAPTGLAIQLADQAGLTLIGFAREGRMTVYTHADRIVSDASR
jgi:formate dehydrogenase accessory protein FdhD